jgi:tyrosine-specific transport protein
MFSKNNKFIGGVLLIAGTQIGAGMLALPITTGIAGFIGAAALFLLCFAYMLTTLFLLLEANCYCVEKDANIISMARANLGKKAEIIAWVSFLLLMYAALSAYISGAGDITKNILDLINFPVATNGISRATLMAIIFGGVAFAGAVYIDSINRVLMVGLAFSYITMIIILIPNISYNNLLTMHNKYLMGAVPVVILSFTSHIVLPSLRDYLNDDITLLKSVIIWGSVISLLVYLVWIVIIVGILPFSGAHGILAVAQANHPIAALSSTIAMQLKSDIIGQNNNLFSFCAISTSFLGVLMGLQDFLADGFKMSKSCKNKFILILCCLIPPLLLISLSPEIFVTALSYGGIFIAVLYGILPPIMVWKARYHNNSSGKYRFPGGKISLIVIALIAIAIIILQILLTQGYLHTA